MHRTGSSEEQRTVGFGVCGFFFFWLVGFFCLFCFIFKEKRQENIVFPVTPLGKKWLETHTKQSRLIFIYKLCI